jgi:hypothetical protein
LKLLSYTGLFGGLEHLKIESRLIDEKSINRELRQDLYMSVGVMMFIKKIQVYYETIKRELEIKPISEWELEHLKIKTKLIDEKFASVMVECVI